MIPTLRNRLNRISAPRVAIWDECHHIGAATWEYIMKAWPNTLHIGLTGTPCRLDGKGLDAYFDEIVTGPSVAELIAMGSLSDWRGFAPSTPDLSGIKVRGGDFRVEDTEEAMRKPTLIGDAVSHYKRICPGTKAVYFCTTVNHSLDQAAAFNANGVRAVHLDGKSSTHERGQAALAMADGHLDVICNVGLFGEGYDLAAQAQRDVTIETVGMMRPTQSLSFYLQMVMRCMRPKSNGDIATILDHAGNFGRHGYPDDDRDWTLKGATKEGSASTMKQCLECFGMFKKNLSACPHCGAEVESAGGRGAAELIHEDGELQEVDKNARQLKRKVEEWECRTIEDMIALGKRRGYKSPEAWAAHLWTAKEAKKKKRHEGQLEFYSKQGRI
jgi:superfamily II DNA or RNA helicase